MSLDFDYQQQMIYWIEVTQWSPFSSMISVMYINGSDVQVSVTTTTMKMNEGYLLIYILVLRVLIIASCNQLLVIYYCNIII